MLHLGDFSFLRSSRYNSFDVNPPFFFAPPKTTMLLLTIQHDEWAALGLGIVPVTCKRVHVFSFMLYKRESLYSSLIDFAPPKRTASFELTRRCYDNKYLVS